MGVALEWIKRHCAVPDGFRKGAPFRPYDYQVLYLGNYYRVKGTARWDPVNPVLAPAFVHRFGLCIGPQKAGKDPLMAAQICLEGVGPALFGGWSGPDEGYVCREHGCRCGWEYPYAEGEPRGMPWPTALIQVTAFSEKATDNTYDALRPMIELGPLADLVPKTGEEFIRLPNGGRIDTVTSEARSRLGNRVTHVSWGELGIYTPANGMDKVYDTQSRGLAGMGGRGSATTNMWDPSEGSVAQVEYEAGAPDIYVYLVEPPPGLSITNKADRRKLFRAVYPPDVRRENGGHVDLDAIEAEASSLILKGKAAQAARFYANLRVTGAGKAFDLAVWNTRTKPGHKVPPKAVIAIGGDGSKTDDTTALIATELATGYQWPIGIWDPREHDGRIPVDLVNAAVTETFDTYTVALFLMDPPYWNDEIKAWQATHGDKVVKGWATARNAEMAAAVRDYMTAIADGMLWHDGDPVLTAHIGNAYKRLLLVKDDQGEPMWALQKETPKSALKIDAATAAVVSWVARGVAIGAGALNAPVRDYSGMDLSIYDLSRQAPPAADKTTEDAT
jgi:hypothetical protein